MHAYSSLSMKHQIRRFDMRQIVAFGRNPPVCDNMTHSRAGLELYVFKRATYIESSVADLFDDDRSVHRNCSCSDDRAGAARAVFRALPCADLCILSTYADRPQHTARLRTVSESIAHLKDGGFPHRNRCAQFASALKSPRFSLAGCGKTLYRLRDEK